LPADDLFVYNYVPDMPYNLPPLPGVYFLPSSAFSRVKVVYDGSQQSNATYPLSNDFVEAEVVAAIKRIQTANPDRFEATEPEFVVYTSHAPFYVQATPEDTRAGFYDELNVLQGLRSTYWTGAGFRAHDSCEIWKFNKEVVLPMLVEG
jgi:hypothetical protein